MACGAYARWDERCDELDHHLCNHNGDEPRVLNGEQGLEYSTVSRDKTGLSVLNACLGHCGALCTKGVLCARIA